MGRTSIWCGLLIALAGAGGLAKAQQAAPGPASPAPASSPTNVKGVTVTAAPPPVRPSIDRHSYDITKDLNATTGTVADVLRNVPALTVDLQGNVSIRGDTNVVIMVDGQPSSLFTGPGRSQALQSVPADEFERVEVITNPSAAFSPEGTGGIVNLISKKTRKPGRSGSVRVNADATGRWNAGFNASQKTDKLTLSVNGGVRRDLQAPTTVEIRDAFATPTEPAFTSVTTTDAPNQRDSWNLRGGADYDPNASTHISASLQFIGFGNRTSFDTQTIEHDQSGDLDQILDRSAVTHDHVDYVGLQTSLKRSFGGDDNDLTVSLGLHRSAAEAESPFADVSLFPPLPEAFDNRQSSETDSLADLKADYERPMAHSAQFKAGYELKVEDDTQSNMAFEGAPTPAGPFDPGQADAFHFDRWIDALYASYQQPIGRFTALAGLRLEQTGIRLDDPASATRLRSDDLHAYPTLHLSYSLTPAQSLLASYGERVQRPGPRDLDPYRVVISPFELRMGNPDLRPEETHEFELAWEFRKHSDFVHAGLYYKINNGGFGDAATDLGDNVFLYQQQNLVSSRNAGAELEASGQIGKKLSYNLSGQVEWAQIDASTLGLIGPHTGTNVSGHAVITWSPTANDMLQVYAWASGRELTAEGYYNPWAVVSLGYRHKVDERLSIFATLQDALASDRFGAAYMTPQLFDHSTNNPHARAFFLGFAYSFGAGPKRDQPIELGAPGGGGGGGP